ncbi:hypothetical protein Cyast_1006 [Cyanobacterium stanieri PCC 7202]|uniref:Uncharacterized protein n=1 Tax=Cyanobacterium stanieri (strain ATCC 29140 / PCC 7202) TaxID=292563 RepID=K9YKI2_CYASC|nr:hypothetical protein Cyast_1006 [Cyanobacterium stanieri PCC 7202]
MDNWEQQLINWLNQAENNFYNFCEEVSQEWENTASKTEKFIDNITEEIESNIPAEINNLMVTMDDFVEELITILAQEDPFHLLEYFLDEQRLGENSQTDHNIVWFEEEKVTPNAEFHPACVGCQNYHGRKYNGNLLVCAIHPYGWTDESCPDWESLEKK